MTTMNVDKLLVAAGAYFGGDGINYDRFEPHKFAALVLANTPPQPEQEPVAWLAGRWQWVYFDLNRAKEEIQVEGGELIPLYTTPPQRTWVGLTEDEAVSTVSSVLPVTSTGGQTHYLQIQHKHALEITRAVEAKLKEKNT